MRTKQQFVQGIRDQAFGTDSNDNEIEILGAAMESAMMRLTLKQAREVYNEMAEYRCSNT